MALHYIYIYGAVLCTCILCCSDIKVSCPLAVYMVSGSIVASVGVNPSQTVLSELFSRLNLHLVHESKCNSNPLQVASILKFTSFFVCSNIIKYSGNHHTWNNNFFVLVLTTFEFISITLSSNANLTTKCSVQLFFYIY